MTKTTALLCSLLLLAATAQTLTEQPASKQIPKFKLIEVYPSAFDVMVHAFDQVLVYVHGESNSEGLDQTLKDFEAKISQIEQLFPTDHTLFAHFNRTNDLKGVLERYGVKEAGFKLITTFHVIDHQQGQDLAEFYTEKVHPRLPLAYRSDLKKPDPHSPFNLVFSYSNDEDLNTFNRIYERIRHFLVDFHTKCLAVAQTGDAKASISLLRGDRHVANYSFFNRTEKEAAEELVQLVNIDTLPTLTTIDEATFSRVFGGSVTDQLIFIHSSDDSVSATTRAAYAEYERAAESNRFGGLAYERVLFTTIDSKFFEQNFNQEVEPLLKDSSNQYLIYFTKTDYDRFQLKRYRFTPKEEQWKSEQLLQFIDDVRNKRLDPEYKSEPIPSEEEQNNKILRKIVGKSFISEVYEKPDQSILVLFIDSKDEPSYANVKVLLEQFTEKYKAQIEGKLITATFDLDKNEHKLLYLKEAPQLILFDKSNKKQTKYLKIVNEMTLETLSQQIRSAVSNVDFTGGSDL